MATPKAKTHEEYEIPHLSLSMTYYVEGMLSLLQTEKDQLGGATKSHFIV